MTTSRSKSRLDLALVERNLVDSRAKAQALIMARRVLLNGQIAEKSGHSVRADDELRVVELEHPWVGRGGMKLAHALAHFSLEVHDLICADLGASTGGFTDVLLEHGAAKVYAIDVGYGQIDASLRRHPRVVNREKVNARYLEPEDFEEPIDFVSADLSFISLRLVLPAIARILRQGGTLVTLIKPQFEAGKGEVGKGGIVRDEATRRAAVERVVQAAVELGFTITGVIESPVRGAEGNVEYLMYARR